MTASMLTPACHKLRDGTEWSELGAVHFDHADAAAKTANRVIRMLQQIGYVIHAEPV